MKNKGPTYWFGRILTVEKKSPSKKNLNIKEFVAKSIASSPRTMAKLGHPTKTRS
jgi:hypothetical protein